MRSKSSKQKTLYARRQSPRSIFAGAFKTRYSSAKGKTRALIISFLSSHSAPEEIRSLTAAVWEMPNSRITILINLICSGSSRTEIKVLLSIIFSYSTIKNFFQRIIFQNLFYLQNIFPRKTSNNFRMKEEINTPNISICRFSRKTISINKNRNIMI